MTPEDTLISYQKSIFEKWVSRDPLILQEMLHFFHPNISLFGSGLHETINSRAGFAQLMQKEHKEVPKPPMLEVVWVKAKAIDNTGYTWGIFHLKIPVEDQFIEMNNLRMSLTWAKEKGKDWQAIHGHTSAPWGMQPKGKAFPMEEQEARNLELEKMVAEKTADLVEKNRELEIETALERVRAASMAMQQSTQFIEVCKILRNQLNKLGLLTEFDTVEILLFEEEVEIVTSYQTQELGPNQQWKLEIAIDELPEFRKMFNAWKVIPSAQRKGNLDIMKFQKDRFDAK